MVEKGENHVGTVLSRLCCVAWWEEHVLWDQKESNSISSRQLTSGVTALTTLSLSFLIHVVG